MADVSRLGGYVLPGSAPDPTAAIGEARAAEALGFGTVFLGERYDTKDLPSMVGALSQVTDRVRLAAGVTHIGTRHPMVLASMGQTLQALTGGRFVLGLGRGADARWQAYGLPAPTLAALADTAGILRRLWAGEHVDYDGPAGRFPDLQLMARPAQAPPRLLLAAVGPRTLRLAGSAFDGAILHPLLTADAVGRAAQLVRQGAESAGRDPDAVEVHTTVLVATAGDPVEVVGARGLGYLLMAGLGEALLTANQWDHLPLDQVRRHPVLHGLTYSELKLVPMSTVGELSAQLPAEWFADASAVGPADHCATLLTRYLAAGATGILLHGDTAPKLGAVVEAFRRAS